MMIAISGVPGVGKSQAARILKKILDADLISITALVKAGKIPHTWDRARKTKIISVKDVQRAVDKITRSPKYGKRAIFIIEGHLSHLLKSDVIFVLRCQPAVLRKRLHIRNWPKKKIDENVQAELLDIITAEASASATRKKAKVYEIDTTHKTARQTAIAMSKIIESKAYGKKFKPGKIAWLKSKEII
jgi:adenylate kinase